MEFTATLGKPSINYDTGKLIIALNANEDVREQYEQIKTCEKLSVSIKKYRKARSLNANAYAWALMSKLAEALESDKDSIYELELEKYGSTLIDEEGQAVIVSVKSKIKMERSFFHYKEIGKGFVNGEEYTHYRLIQGSSEYDTEQMAKFIKGVVEDCKELGIETKPQHEIDEMLERWAQEIEKAKKRTSKRP